MYTITISNPGSHFANPLLKLRGGEYSTRAEACEAIYNALYDVIDGEHGCEMVSHKNIDDEIRSICGDLMLLADESGDQATIYHDDDVPTNRAVPVRTLADEIVQNVVYDTDLLKFHSGANWDDFPELKDSLLSALREYETYADRCHDYIMREGYATEDGVTATVEEVAE